MPIHLYDIYRNPNIGIFSKASDKLLLMPTAYSKQKSDKLASLLGVEMLYASVGNTRLLGPLIAMNNKGILLSRFAEEEEALFLRKSTGLNVEKLDSVYSSVGNLIAANDFGAAVADILSAKEIAQIKDVLDVPVEKGFVAGYYQLGSIVKPSNSGAIAHPRATDAELKWLKEILKVDCEVCTINGGVPFVSSGLLVNTRAAIVGSSTSGPELFMLGKAFKV